MNSETQNDQSPSFLDYLLICVKWRKVIALNVVIITILAVILSLIVPLWFTGSATILSSAGEDSSSTFSALLSSIPVSTSLLGLGGASQSVSLAIAILESRTVMEDVVHKFGLEKRYRSKDLERAVKTLRERASFEINEDGTISISVTARTGFFHPRRQIDEARIYARDMTNFFIEKLDSLNKALRNEKAHNVRLFLETRYSQNLKDLAKAENDFKVFQEKHGAISLPEQTIAALETAAGLKAQILTKKIEIGMLEETMGKGHAELIRAKTELQQLENGYRILEIGEGEDMSNLFPSFDQIPELGLEYARLFREIKLQELLLEFILPQFEQAKLQEAKDTPTIQVIDEAVLPIKKARPKRALIVILSTVLSFLFSFFYVIYRERMERLATAGGDSFRKLTWIKNQLRDDFTKFRKKNNHHLE